MVYVGVELNGFLNVIFIVYLDTYASGAASSCCSSSDLSVGEWGIGVIIGFWFCSGTCVVVVVVKHRQEKGHSGQHKFGIVLGITVWLSLLYLQLKIVGTGAMNILNLQPCA